MSIPLAVCAFQLAETGIAASVPLTGDHTCRPQIVKGRVEKTVRQMCLLEAPFVKGVERTVDEVIAATTAKLGEKISVRRFVRWVSSPACRVQASELEQARLLREGRGAHRE